MIDLLLALSAYLIGTIPSAYIFTRLFSRDDIRLKGTGNVGAANTMKQIGWMPGILTLVVDSGKSMLIVYLAMRFGSWNYLPYVCVFLVILGHMYNIFLGFKGGKGLACLLGALIILAPATLLFLFAVIGIIKTLIKDTPTATALGLLPLPFFLVIYHNTWTYFIFGLAIYLLILTKYLGDCRSFFIGRGTTA